MFDRVQELMRDFPVLSSWNTPQLFEDTITINDVPFYLIGLSSSQKEKPETVITGSAAACAPFHATIAERAYFELLERMMTVEFNLGVPTFSNDFCYSKSNGIALHTDTLLAKSGALNELIERDAILRHWFQKVAPQKTSVESSSIHFVVNQLKDVYDFEFYQFPSDAASSTNSFVTGSFAFPKIKEAPFCYGFGAASSLKSSLEKSFCENLQTIGFLWGESFDDDFIFSPTPSYHQSIFCSKNGEEMIRDWLSSTERILPQIRTPKKIEVSFKDFTPQEYQGKISLLKASSNEVIPLVFGKNYKLSNFDISEERYIHPIC